MEAYTLILKLEERLSVARLYLLYKVVNGLVAVPLPDYIQSTQRKPRYCHSMTFRQIHTSNDSYKYPFFALAIAQCNALPDQHVSPDSAVYSRLI